MPNAGESAVEGTEEGTVLVRGVRVPAWRDIDDPNWVMREVMCAHRRRVKLSRCGAKVAQTFTATRVAAPADRPIVPGVHA